MSYTQEKEMYVAVSNWLESFLNDKYKRWPVRIFDSSRKRLNRLINENNLNDLIPSEFVSWDIQVDIVGFVLLRNSAYLAFVECKNRPITLRDLSQLIGYSRVAKPQYSFIISPQGPSDSLHSLLKTYNRLDVLIYDYKEGRIPKSITVAKWLEQSNSIDWSSIITGNRS